MSEKDVGLEKAVQETKLTSRDVVRSKMVEIRDILMLQIKRNMYNSVEVINYLECVKKCNEIIFHIENS